MSNRIPIATFLDMETLTENEALGHALEMKNLIPHDQDRLTQIDNDLCRGYMREAEAFAAGYQLALDSPKGVH